MSEVVVPAGSAGLPGSLAVPADARGLVLFAHGSGSSRHSPRNRRVAATLNDRGYATLLLDLLTADEERVDRATAELRFDIALLGERLVATIDWLAAHDDVGFLQLGLFGASTGAAGALIAAAERPEAVRAVVSRGGRPDLAGDALERVEAPTLLLVGALDAPVIAMNRDAQARMHAETELEIVSGASHLFEEPGALEEVARLALAWFRRHLTGVDGERGILGPWPTSAR